MPRGLFDSRRPPVPRAHSDPGTQKTYSVNELTALIKGAIEKEFGSLWVEGEVSNLSRPVSGHIYFTLKDESAQLQAVIFRGVASRIRFPISDGDELRVFGRVTVYVPRGQHQIVIERVEPKGLGALQAAFEKLKERLAKEGLFDAKHKKPIPFLPRRIGIVTSPTGAAVQDMMQVIWRRFPNAHLVLRPVRVQGEGAAAEIAQATTEFNAWNEQCLKETGTPAVDVLIVGRGGGSLEDLWAFNEEAVARAIFRSRIPVISAVGHEVDVSIADLVADVRALTPSEAGERVVPRLDELVRELDESALRLANSARGRLGREREHVNLLARSYGLHAPVEIVARERQRMDEFASRLQHGGTERLRAGREGLGQLAGKLEELSPLGVLARGYSFTSRAGEPRRAIREASALSQGDRLVTRFARGEAESVVEDVRGAGEE
jgi:exodeoxyribonuclease VII large subunit